MKAKKNSLLYHFCAFTGWLIILCALLFTILLLVAGESLKSSALLYLGAIGAIVIGTLIVMVAEKNIFKALGTVFGDILNIILP